MGQYETVDEYISSLPDDVQSILGEIRQIIKKVAPAVRESISYQIIKADIDGDALIFIGGWKHHIGLYPIPALERALEEEVAPYRAAKDTVRFRYSDPIPHDLFERIVVALLEKQSRPGDQPR